MITIKGKMKALEREVYKEFAEFALGHFVSAKRIRKTRITIRFVKPKSLKGQDLFEIKKYKAWCKHYVSPERFVITINANMRGRSALLCMAHELVHVKQYMKREMFDYANGDVWFKGKRHSDWQEDVDYYFTGWEIEAYGLEQGLYELFKRRK